MGARVEMTPNGVQDPTGRKQSSTKPYSSKWVQKTILQEGKRPTALISRTGKNEQRRGAKGE